MAAKKKAAKKRKTRGAARKAPKKAAKARRAKPVRKSARKPARKPASKKVATMPAAVPPAVAELDERIALLRNNLRDLTAQATAYSGASQEELAADRIAEQEARLQLLIKQRDELVRRGS
jgi:uncharacterized small protein (DUF1192 family)